MIIDDKGKLFGKISIVDILVVCLILAGIAGAYYKFGKSKTISLVSKPNKIEITFFTEDLPAYVGAGIKPGDIARDRVSGSAIGKVKEVVAGPDIFYSPNDQGQMVKSAKEGYVSLKVVVEGNGIFGSDQGASFSNVDYYVNKWFEVKAGNAQYYTRVQNIRKIGE